MLDNRRERITLVWLISMMDGSSAPQKHSDISEISVEISQSISRGTYAKHTNRIAVAALQQHHEEQLSLLADPHAGDSSLFADADDDTHIMGIKIDDKFFFFSFPYIYT